MLSESYGILHRLRLSHGLYVASPSEDYTYVWLRDSVYMSLPFLDKEDGWFEKSFHRMFDLFAEYEWKLDILRTQKPKYIWEYIHARYSAQEVKEIHSQDWGHAQHDMIGAILFGVGEGVRAGRSVFRSQKDIEIVQKLVDYLKTIEYWKDPDNGMWEENREVHMSSVGACVAGLLSVKDIVSVPEDMISNGLSAIGRLFPTESASKQADLAQLSLVYPYRLFGDQVAEEIVSRVESRLLRQRGVIRYEGDSYYSTLEKEFKRDRAPEFYLGTEAEWCFGIPWLALCHHELGNAEKAKEYLAKSEEIALSGGVLPELYYAKTDKPNPNTPLGWSSAMYILAKEAICGSREFSKISD